MLILFEVSRLFCTVFKFLVDFEILDLFLPKIGHFVGNVWILSTVFLFIVPFPIHHFLDFFQFGHSVLLSDSKRIGVIMVPRSTSTPLRQIHFEKKLTTRFYVKLLKEGEGRVSKYVVFTH